MGMPRSLIGVVGGITLALALHALGGIGAVVGLAQPPTNGTVTQSTTSSTSFESPPACSVVGSSRQVQTLTPRLSVGPECIGIGNRDLVNPAPACGGLPPAAPPLDPGRGTVFLVPFGQSNTNFNLHTETVQCVAAVPALPLPLFLGLGGALAGLGLWGARRLKGGTA